MSVPRTPRRGPGLALLFTALALAIVSCRDATEIRLNVRTNVPCTNPANWKGVAVYVGSPDSTLDTKAPALTTTSCAANGAIGSLVVVPSGVKDEAVELRVVAGLSFKPEECAAHRYQGCIVVRRSVRFSEHASLDLDIDLTSDCVGLICDATHTCVNGTCNDVETIDVSVPLGESSVRCGDNGIRCGTVGNVCCLTVDTAAGTTFGECKPAAGCPPTSAVLNCDESSDCGGLLDDVGEPLVCIAAYQLDPVAGDHRRPASVQGAQCLKQPTFGQELCQTRLPCRHGLTPCHATEGIPANALPGYFWCDD